MGGGKTYERLDAVAHLGASYLALRDTEAEPGKETADWMLLAEGISIEGVEGIIDTRFEGLSAVATSGAYADLSGVPQALPADGGDADTIDGFHASKGNIPHTAVVRGSDGSVLSGRVSNWASSRSSGAMGNYIRFCKIITHRYECSAPIYITLIGKNQSLRSILVDFVNTIENDPGLKDFKISGQSGGGQNVYIAKEAVNTWRLFARSKNWDWLMASNSAFSGPTQPSLEFETTVVSSLPAGAIEANEVVSIL